MREPWGISGTGLEAQSSQTDAVKSLIRWESPHPLSIAGVNHGADEEFEEGQGGAVRNGLGQQGQPGAERGRDRGKHGA